GRKYRLPTEAEWEYSCRGGASSSSIFHYGNSLSSTQANFDGRLPYGGRGTGPYLERTCKVGSYPANAFGLHDMHGNVWEWCSDWYDEGYYPVSPSVDPPGPANGYRGVLLVGSWFYGARTGRSPYRYRYEPEERHHDYGMR